MFPLVVGHPRSRVGFVIVDALRVPFGLLQIGQHTVEGELSRPIQQLLIVGVERAVVRWDCHAVAFQQL